MSNEIERYQEQGLTIDGRTARSSDDEIGMALAPMFVEYPDMKFSDERMALWCLQLRDIKPDVLARAVLDMLRTNKYQPTVASIREQLPEKQPPGPRSNEVDPRTLKPIPTTFYRPDPEEDKRQRMDRLRMTRQVGDRI